MKNTLDRLSNPRLPLSVDEDRDYRTVRSVVFFLRLINKRVSRRTIETIFKAADFGMRHGDIGVYLRRLYALEALQNQGGDHLGTSRGPLRTYDGTSYEHDGDQSPTRAESMENQKDASLPLTVNINKKGGKEKATENDESDPRPPMSPEARAARARVCAMLHIPIPEGEGTGAPARR